LVEGAALTASRGEVGKERETKDDGRYIIFYTFIEDENDEPSEGRGGD
jgi:hypothetical protein